MHTSAVFTFSLVLALFSMLVQADVPYPTEPADGPKVYNAKSTCRFKWKKGDSSWASFNLELMTGSNFVMKSLSMVAKGLQGDQDGEFEFQCPTVDINAPIYFYQMTSSSASSPAWSTRFTIASETGETVSAPNPNQPPPDNQPIGWGVGSIVSDNSETTTTSSTSSSTSTSTTGTSTVSTTTSSTSTTSSSSSDATPTVTTTTGTTTLTSVWTTTSDSGDVQTNSAIITSEFTSVQTAVPTTTISTSSDSVSQSTNSRMLKKTQTQSTDTVASTSTAASSNNNAAVGSFSVSQMHLQLLVIFLACVAVLL